MKIVLIKDEIHSVTKIDVKYLFLPRTNFYLSLFF